MKKRIKIYLGHADLVRTVKFNILFNYLGFLYFNIYIYRETESLVHGTIFICNLHGNISSG